MTVIRARSASASMVADRLGRGVQHVVHPGGNAQPTVLGAMNQDGAEVVTVGELSLQRPDQRRWVTRITGCCDGAVVRQEVGLQCGVEPVVQGFDLVGDGREHALGERDEPLRRDPDARAVRRRPVGPTLENAGAQVQRTLVEVDPAVLQVERRVPDVEPDELSVGHVDDGLAGLREPVASLGVGERTLLVEAADVRPWRDARLTLLQRSAQTDVPVRQREQRLGRPQVRRFETRRPQSPWIDLERPVASSVRALTRIQQVRKILHDDVRAALAQGFRLVAAIHPDDEAEPACPAGHDARLCVLEDSGLTRLNPKTVRGLHEGVRCRLARQALLPGDHAVHALLDEMLDAGGADHLGPVGRGGDDRRADSGVVDCLQVGDRAGDRPPRRARPVA